MIWLKFIAIQFVMLLATVCGWFILLPFCLAQAWTERAAMSINPEVKDSLSIWAWKPLNYVYGNPEDGVNGKQARIWNAEGSAQVPYMPGAWAPWRAYCWSAWRNSADNLKYVFAEPDAPLVTFKLFNRTAKIGWQNGLPVLSI